MQEEFCWLGSVWQCAMQYLAWSGIQNVIVVLFVFM